MARLAKGARYQSELWIVYKDQNRAGRRVEEMVWISLPMAPMDGTPAADWAPSTQLRVDECF